MKRKIVNVCFITLFIVLMGACDGYTDKVSLDQTNVKKCLEKNKENKTIGNAEETSERSLKELKCLSNCNIVYTIQANSRLYIVCRDDAEGFVLNCYEMKNNILLKTSLNKGIKQNESIMRIIRVDEKNEYVLIYCIIDEHVSCLIYNLSLSEHEEVSTSVDDLFGNNINMCVLPKKRIIVYYTDYLTRNDKYGGFYSTDYNGKDKQILFKFDSMNPNKFRLNTSYAVEGSENEDKIFFIGSFFKTHSGSSFPCYGMLEIKEKRVISYDGCRSEMICRNGDCYFMDEINIDGSSFNGDIVKLDIDKPLDRLTFLNNDEGIAGGVSESCKYYYSYISEGSRTKINIYDVKNKKIVCKRSINKYADKIYLFDEEKLIIYIYTYQGCQKVGVIRYEI